MGKISKLCGLCCGCSKPSPAYKSHVRNLYPATDNGAARFEPQNVSDLVRYASSHPGKLKEIGRYLHKRINTHLKERRWGHVKVGVKAFNVLLETFRSDSTMLQLFDSWVFRCVLLLMENPNDDMHVLATGPLTRLVEYQDEFAEPHFKVNVFFQELVRMCGYTNKNADLQYRVRFAGLKALSKVILFNREDIVTVDNFKIIIPVVLTNLGTENETEQAKTEEEFLQINGALLSLGPRLASTTSHVADGAAVDEDFRNVGNASNSLDVVARPCLRDICALARFDRVTRLLSPIYAFLDSAEWASLPFALDVLRTVSDHSKLSTGQGYILITTALQHLSDCPSLAAQRRLVLVHIRLVLAMRLGLGSWAGLIEMLLRRLRETYSASTQESTDSQQTVRIALAKLAGACCQRFERADEVPTLVDTVMMDIKDYPPSSDDLTRSLLQVALEASRFQKHLTVGNGISSTLRCLVKLCSLGKASNSLLPDILPIIDNLLVPVPSFDASVSIRSSDKVEKALRSLTMDEGEETFLGIQTQSQEPDGPDDEKKDEQQQDPLKSSFLGDILTEELVNLIHLTIHARLKTGPYPPEVIASCFRSLALVLQVRPIESAMIAVPLVFQWQKASRSRRLHALVAVYLMRLANVFIRFSPSRHQRTSAETLRDHVHAVYQARVVAQLGPPGLALNDVGLLVCDENAVDGEGSADETEHAWNENHLISANEVLPLVSDMLPKSGDSVSNDRRPLMELLAHNFEEEEEISSRVENSRRHSSFLENPHVGAKQQQQLNQPVVTKSASVSVESSFPDEDVFEAVDSTFYDVLQDGEDETQELSRESLISLADSQMSGAFASRYETQFFERTRRLKFLEQDVMSDAQLRQMLMCPVVTESLSPSRDRLMWSTQELNDEPEQRSSLSNVDSRLSPSPSLSRQDSHTNVFDLPEPEKPSRSQRMLSVFTNPRANPSSSTGSSLRNVRSLEVLRQSSALSSGSLFRMKYPRLASLNDSLSQT